MAKNKDKESKSADKAAGKDKKKDKKKGKGAEENAPYSSIATHPRALVSIRRAKGWTGLAGFAIAALLSIQASVPLVQVGLRALGAGVAGYMLAWWVGVQVWRQLMIAEHRAAAEEIRRRRTESAEKGTAEAQPTG